MTIDIVSVQANAITELRKRVAAAEQEAKDWQARHQGVTSLFEATQASYGELQGDYRRLSQAHQEILLAHGSLLREHRAQSLTTNSAPASTANALASGDSGIEFTDENLCDRLQCPTTPPHRHITPTHPPKMPGTGVPPCPARINDIQAPPPPTTTSARFQATIEDDFGDSDVIPTRNPASIRTSTNNNMRPHGTPLDINQAPPASNTSEKGGAQGNPNLKPITVDQAVDLIQAGHGDRVYLGKAPMDVNNIVGGPNEAELAAARRAYQEEFEQRAADIYNQAFDPNKTLQQLRDSARIASKFADAENFRVGDPVINANGQVVGKILGGRLTDASGEAGPTVTDPEFNQLLTDLDRMRMERTIDYGYSTGVLGHPEVIEANEREIRELRQGIDVVSDCGFQAQDGSDETHNTPDKSTEDR